MTTCDIFFEQFRFSLVGPMEEPHEFPVRPAYEHSSSKVIRCGKDCVIYEFDYINWELLDMPIFLKKKQKSVQMDVAKRTIKSH